MLGWLPTHSVLKNGFDLLTFMGSQICNTKPSLSILLSIKYFHRALVRLTDTMLRQTLGLWMLVLSYTASASNCCFAFDCKMRGPVSFDSVISYLCVFASEVTGRYLPILRKE